jgi:hypothetical protein
VNLPTRRQAPNVCAALRTPNRFAIPTSEGEAGTCTPRILVIGDLMTDVIVRPEGPLARGSDRRASIAFEPGGSAANQAAWLTSFGVGSAPARVLSSRRRITTLFARALRHEAKRRSGEEGVLRHDGRKSPAL